MDRPAHPSLSGQRVLVVEDEFLIAMQLEGLLARLGCQVIGPAPSVAGALAQLDRERPDAALLDFNLRGEMSTPVAAALRARGVPFIVVSGYSGPEGVVAFEGVPWLRKPVERRQLVRALSQLLGSPEGKH